MIYVVKRTFSNQHYNALTSNTIIYSAATSEIATMTW